MLHKKTQAFMGKYDGSGQSTKAAVQMLEEKPAPTNVWQQLGVQEPSAAANNAMRQSDDHGYKAPVQMLEEKRAPTNVWQQIGVQEPSAAANNAMRQSDDHGCVLLLSGSCIPPMKGCETTFCHNVHEIVGLGSCMFRPHNT